MPCSRILTAITSSTPTPMAWPVKPLVLAMMMLLADSPKAWRRAVTSAEALPPRAGVKVSCDMKTVCGAMAWRLRPKRRSPAATRFSMTMAMWFTSSRVPWKALLLVSLLSNSTMPRMPRSRTASSLSTMRAQAPMPMIVPWRRLSKGRAASATWSLVVAAPTDRKPAPTHSIRWSPVTSSPPTTTTRRQRPLRIQSSAMAMAWAVLAQAALTWVLGPRAPMYWANWLWPIDRMRNRKRRSKT